jgi:translation initiation factor IF-2
MKAIELAKKNQTAINDLFGICRDLGIQCESEDSDISGNDVFLVEKRIQTKNEERARHAAEILRKKADDHNKGKKIKLKRKVHLSHEKEHEAAEANEEKPIASTATKAAAPHHHRPAPVASSEKGESKTPFGARQGGGSRSGGYQGQRPSGTGGGYQGQRPSGTGGGYQGQRPSGTGGGYQGQRPSGTGGGYQGQRPSGTGGGYQGQRPSGTGGGYQGQRPSGTGGGYQGQRPSGTGGGYQGQRPSGTGGPRTGGGFRGPGGPGGRGPGGRPFNNQQRPFAQLGGDKKDTAPENLDVKKEKDKKKSKERDKEKVDKKLRRNEKESIESKMARDHRRRKIIEKPEFAAPTLIEITDSVLVGELAKKLNIKASEVIAKLMKLGVMATINQVLDSDTASILAAEYGTEVKVVSLYEETVIREEEEDKEESRGHRPPIVTVMGHVDHGKTKLLDAIRSTNVIDTEFGGITQHIGAYRVKVKDQFVTFLDTPGHEAFTTMRARGAKVTDIVILVVAANDGVMPQTREAVAHAKDAGVPIIVAINKCDLPDANPMKVKQELMAYELVPEELGGTTLYAEISAKQKTNIEGILEKVLLQAEMLELKANASLRAKGTVIESKLDPGRGAVASILVQNGTLHVGDPFVCGVFSGKVRAMFDDQGKPVEEAGPSTPIEVLGLDGIPAAGDPFQAVASEKYSKQISQKRLKVTLESLNEMIKDGEVHEVRIIIKADVDGSVQALKDSLEKLSTSEVRVKVILSTAGTINESDVMLASASNAIIIGYHVRPSARIADLAERERVSIKTYNIIFEVTDSIKAAMEGLLSPELKEEIMGTGEIRQVFKVSKVGTIAGCVVLSGKIQRTNKVRLLRDGVIVFDGVLKSLKRFKDDASEVQGGQECGIALENYNDIKVNDTFEAYRTVEIAKKLEG